MQYSPGHATSSIVFPDLFLAGGRCLHSLAGNIAEAMQCLSGARQSEESKDGGAQLGAWIKSVVEDADFAPLHAVPEFAVIVTAPVGLGM
jgi:hypothetical protein